jgi:hypothetical protein
MSMRTMSEAPAQTQLVNELAVYLARHPEATPMRRPPGVRPAMRCYRDSRAATMSSTSLASSSSNKSFLAPVGLLRG